MMSYFFSILVILSAVELSIESPSNGGVYGGNWLTLKVMVQNDAERPDSVTFSLNGQPFVPVPRLNTDWYTYMQNSLHHGYSESPAPMTDEIFWTAPVTGNLHEFINPIIVNGVVYYAQGWASSGNLQALDAATGEILWTYFVGDSDDPPTWSDGRLYHAADSVYCIDAQTGACIWTFGEAGYTGSTPCVWEDRVLTGRDDPYYVAHLYCLRTSDGQILWDRELEGMLVSCAAVCDGIYYVPTYLGPLYAIDAADGETVWANSDAPTGYWDSSPLIVDGGVYIGGYDGYVRRFDALTGATDWTTLIGLYISATPARYGQNIICGSDDYPDVGVLASLSMSDGSILWSIPTNIHGSPAVADGVVYWGGNLEPFDIIYAADAATGDIIWSFDPDAGEIGLQSTPAITDGVMYYASTDGNLYAFGTGLKWTYRDDLYAEVGENELTAVSWSGGTAVAADTVSFTANETGIEEGHSFSHDLLVFPNPFIVSTRLTIRLDSPVHVSLKVFDLSGRLVRTIAEGDFASGTHSFTWDSRDESENELPSGVYFCRFTTQFGSVAKAVCLLR